MLDEDTFSYDFLGETRVPLSTLGDNDIKYFHVCLERQLHVSGGGGCGGVWGDNDIKYFHVCLERQLHVSVWGWGVGVCGGITTSSTSTSVSRDSYM